MANLKQRLRRKNSSGSYDTIYLQTDLSNVTGILRVSNGGTGTDLTTLTGNAFLRLSSGKDGLRTEPVISVQYGGTGATTAAGARSNLGAASSSHNHAATAITYGSGSNVSAEIDSLKSSVSNGKSLIASAITDKGISTASDATFQTMATNIGSIPSMPTPPAWVVSCKNQDVGTTVTVDGYEWIIVNKTSYTATLGLRYWYTDTPFGSNSTYKGSTIANLAATFESNTLSTETKQWLNNVTVEGVTAKVFIPSYEQFDGGFSYYHYTTKSNRIFRDSSNNAKYTWTSSAHPDESSKVWYVYTDGQLTYGLGLSYSRGFRPHMEVMLAVPI